MGASDLLVQLRSAGLTLDLDAGRLLVKPRSRITADIRETIKANREQLVEALTPRRSANPLMTAEQADAAHTPMWNDAEIETFTNRVLLFIRRGVEVDMADHLAERLLARDRDGDDRHACIECRHGRARRCPDGEPLAGEVLHRCPGFSEEAR